MKTKEKQNSNEVMEGYNPRIYRSLSMLFGILTILNVVVIVYAFALTGYGLWHAEDALSYIAKINSSFDNINENVQNVVIHQNDPDLVEDSVTSVKLRYQDIAGFADEFRQIDLSNIDKTIPADFDAAMSKIDRYYNAVLPKLEDAKIGKGVIEELQGPDMEILRKDASNTISELFEKQDESTYGFFCRVGQSFLLVPLFLISTMSAGLFAISKSKKRDYAFAMNLKNSKQKTDNMREKAKAIAYTNVLTGLKNRYAFNDILKDRLTSDNVNIALYSFNSFRSINEFYGRDTADEFLIATSKKLVEQFGKKAEIFSTETDELCVLFQKDIQRSEALELSQKMLDLLSEPYQLQNATIRLNIACCFKNAPFNPEASASAVSELMIAMDKTVNKAIALSSAQNHSQLIQVGR